LAILQISKIQVRRGLYENLPEPLSSGEFGWALDERRLFIGNGTTAEGAPLLGNTEIITEYNVKDFLTFKGTYQYRGLAAGYEVQTGPNTMDPATRSWQSKFDDTVSLRDFSTTEDNTSALNGIGDGVDHGSDVVDVFNRAITHLYKIAVLESEPRVRRTLNIPAGTYILSGDFIRMLPYVKLKGEGKNCTFIVQADGTQPCVISTCDSQGRTGFGDPVIVSVDSSQPGKIEVDGITFVAQNDQDVIEMDSVADALFSRVGFTGSLTLPTELNKFNSGNACVRLGAPFVSQPKSNAIMFLNCDFSGQTMAFSCTSNAYNVNFLGCYFNQLGRGISLGQSNPTPYSIKISESYFENIYAEAIYTINETSNIVSAHNHFKNVGKTIDGTVVQSPIISFGGPNSYSIGDTFDRPFDNENFPLVALNSFGSFATLPDGQLMLGQLLTVGGQTYNLLDTASSNTLVGVLSSATNTPATFEYRIKRGGAERIGVMKVIGGEATVTYDDEYVESDTTDITLWPWLNQSSGLMEIWYVASPTGSNATLKLTSRTLI
jgi:hypothetical protein